MGRSRGPHANRPRGTPKNRGPLLRHARREPIFAGHARSALVRRGRAGALRDLSPVPVAILDPDALPADQATDYPFAIALRERIGHVLPTVRDRPWWRRRCCRNLFRFGRWRNGIRWIPIGGRERRATRQRRAFRGVGAGRPGRGWHVRRGDRHHGARRCRGADYRFLFLAVRHHSRPFPGESPAWASASPPRRRGSGRRFRAIRNSWRRPMRRPRRRRQAKMRRRCPAFESVAAGTCTGFAVSTAGTGLRARRGWRLTSMIDGWRMSSCTVT